jgi:hypothetical protein
METQMLAVERDGSIDIVDDIADLNGGHAVLLLSSLLCARPLAEFWQTGRAATTFSAISCFCVSS